MDVETSQPERISTYHQKSSKLAKKAHEQRLFRVVQGFSHLIIIKYSCLCYLSYIVFLFKILTIKIIQNL